MRKKILPILLGTLALALLLAGCVPMLAPDPTPAPAPTPSPTPVPTPTPTVYLHSWDPASKTLRVGTDELEDLAAQSALLPALEKIVLIDTVDDEAVLTLLREAFPDCELSYRVELGGRLIDSAETELDLTWLQHEDVPAVCERLALLPGVTRVSLAEDAPWEDVGAFQALPRALTVDKPFKLYGRRFNVTDATMDLNNSGINDGAAALRAALPYMKDCYQVDMEDCGLRNDALAELRDEFPQVKIVWRVRFSIYTVRTDETRILASIKDIGMTGETVACLKYCTDVRYLDLGHNCINDISFVSYMPDLEVAILAINYWSDASPLANCHKLEYLEIFNTNCFDLSPLAELHNLRHLNICWLKNLSDVTPLYGLTQLERLWIGSSEYHSIPRAQLEELRRRLPDTEINTTTDNPTFEGWREGPRYELLWEQMGYGLDHMYST